jgi:hypothetical protein
MPSLESMQTASATRTWDFFRAATANPVQTRWTFMYIDAPTIELGTSTSQQYVDLVQFERGIQTLLHGLTTGEPLQRPAAWRRLAEQIVQHEQHEETGDIEAWARRLANDVARLTD